MKKNTIRIRARIEAFSDLYCLLHDIENLTDSKRFLRKHVWIPIKAVESFKTGDFIELTGNLYIYFGKVGINKIRNVRLVD